MSAAQQPVNQAVQHITFTGKVFTDTDSVSSYANSVMQCLLLSPAICSAIQQSTSTALNNLCTSYVSKTDGTLDCSQLRQELGAPYDGPHAENLVKFLQALVDHSSQLSSVLQHTVRLHTHCTCCSSVNFTDHQQHIIALSIPTTVKSLKLAELMNNYLEWTQSTDQLCNACKHPVKIRTQIININHVLVLQMDVWSTVGGKILNHNNNVTSIPDSLITVGSCTYKLMSAVSLLCLVTDQVVIIWPYCQ